MDFGLGLILSFTDNASAGMNGAVNSLNSLTTVASQASDSLNSLNNTALLMSTAQATSQIGDSLISSGGKITGIFSSLLGKVQSVGSEYEGFKITLDSLYGSAEKADSAIEKLMDFSTKSPLEVDDVKEMLVVLQSQGVDAFKQLQGSVTGTRQETLAWLTDLMAFKPDVPAERWKLAFQNYIGSGEDKILRNALDMGKIPDILGHGISDTTEGRMNDLMEIVDKKNLTGLSEKMSTSWQGVASNIDDAWTKLYKSIADNGVFENLKNSFVGLSGVILDMPNEEISALGKVIAEALNMIVKPISKITGKISVFINKVVDLAKTHPSILKWAIVVSTLTGALLIFSGVALKMVSTLANFTLVMNSIGGSFSLVGSTIASGVGVIASKLLFLGGIIGVLFAVWQTDFLGIRSILTDFVFNVYSSFSTAVNAVNGSVSNMISTLIQLENQDGFWVGITMGLMRLFGAFKFVAEAWNDNTLSEESFQKAHALGILPLIEAVLDLKYRFEFFKEGFIDGWNKIGNRVKETISSLTESINSVPFALLTNKITDFLSGFMSDDVSKDTENWKSFGNMMGVIAGKVIIVGGAFAILKKAGGTLGTILSLAKPLVGLIISNPIVAIILGVVTAFGFLYKKSEQFQSTITSLFEKIGTAFSDLANPLKGVLIDALIRIIPVAIQIFSAVQSFLPKITECITKISSMIVLLLGTVIQMVYALLPVILSVISTVVSSITSLAPSILSIIGSITDIINNLVIPVILDLADMLVPFVCTVIELIGNLIKDVLPIVVDLINTIVPVVTKLISIIIPMLRNILEILEPIIQSVLGIVSSILGHLIPVIQTVIKIVSNIISMVVNIVSIVTPIIIQIVQAISSILMPVINTLISIIGAIINIVMDVAQKVTSVIGLVVSIITGIVNVVSSVVGSIVSLVMPLAGVIVGAISTLIQAISTIIIGIITVVTTVWNTITSIFGNAVGFFTDVFTVVFNRVTSIFQGIADFFSNVWNCIVTSFGTIGDAISGAIRGAINNVLSGAVNMVNRFINAINGAISIINAVPGVSISKLDTLSVPQLAKGGVVDNPTLSVIGEAGKEAVVPLENNTEWTNNIAKLITSNLNKNNLDNTTPSNDLTPILNTFMGAVSQLINAVKEENSVPTPIAHTTQTSKVEEYKQDNITSNNNNSKQPKQVIDASVHFNEGSIVIYAKDSSQSEVEKLAELIMQKIERKQQLNKILNYQS